MYIYKITNKINGKIYVGQSRYKNDSYLGSGINIKAAIEIYGSHNFFKEYLDEAISQDELDDKEKYWIKKLNAQNPNIGYNIADGGWNHLTITEEIKKKISNTLKKKYDNGYVNNRLGCKMSDESKKRISDSNKGRTLSKETKDKMSAKHKGKSFSEESKKKMSEAKLGIILSTKHKENISESLKGRSVSEETKNKLRESNLNKTQAHSKKVTALNLVTGEILTFNNISQAARQLNTYRSYIRNNKVKGFKIQLD